VRTIESSKEQGRTVKMGVQIYELIVGRFVNSVLVLSVAQH
jgi:hypothetical protein